MTPERKKEIEDEVKKYPSENPFAPELLSEISRLEQELDRQGKQASGLLEKANTKVFMLVKELRTIRSYSNQQWIIDLVNDTLKRVGEE